MEADIKKAKRLLLQQGCTCVLQREDATFSSNQRGVKPLLDFLESGRDFRNFSAADKVVGKATAFLYCLLGITALHAQVLSKPALQVLESHNICVTWDQLVDGIRNRENTGPCPMEQATRDVQTPEDALLAIRKTLKALSSTP